MRANKDSVMAMLEAFAYDPLISWRLLVPGKSTDNAVTNDRDARNGDDKARGTNGIDGKSNAATAGALESTIKSVLNPVENAVDADVSVGNQQNNRRARPQLQPQNSSLAIDDTPSAETDRQINARYVIILSIIILNVNIYDLCMYLLLSNTLIYNICNYLYHVP